MASTRIEIPQGAWTAITTTDKEGSIYHNSGGNVSYTEAETAPTTYDGDTPISGSTQTGDDLPYYGVGASEFIFAYSPDGIAELTITPRES